tara:strand:+ start:355 stop:507 length:153 start_codon:yes stop_codon:yes gene_type:complete
MKGKYENEKKMLPQSKSVDGHTSAVAVCEIPEVLQRDRRVSNPKSYCDDE